MFAARRILTDSTRTHACRGLSLCGPFTRRVRIHAAAKLHALFDVCLPANGRKLISHISHFHRLESSVPLRYPRNHGCAIRRDPSRRRRVVNLTVPPAGHSSAKSLIPARSPLVFGSRRLSCSACWIGRTRRSGSHTDPRHPLRLESARRRGAAPWSSLLVSHDIFRNLHVERLVRDNASVVNSRLRATPVSGQH